MPTWISDITAAQATLAHMATTLVGTMGVHLAVDGFREEDEQLVHPSRWRQATVGVVIRDMEGQEAGAWAGSLTNQAVVDLLNACLARAAMVVTDDATGLYLLIRQTGMSLRWASWFQTNVAERCLRLGLVRRQEDAQGLDATLEGCRLRYKSATPFLGCGVQTAIDMINTGKEGLRYATALAHTALAVYDEQVALAGRRGLLPLLLANDMPAAMHHLEVTWNGVYINLDHARRALREVEADRADMIEKLALVGILHPDDENDIKRWIRRQGRLHFRWFQVRKGLEIDGERLKQALAEHPVYGLIRRFRQCQSVLNYRWLRLPTTWPDGRVHPEQVPIYANTGRSLCRNPGIAGVPKDLRHLVQAPAGFGIAEVDYGSMELAIAAGLYMDDILLGRYLGGDALNSLEQVIFTVAKDPVGCSRRDMTKRVVYGGMFYGASIWKIAKWLGISEDAAEQLMKKLEALFPRVQRGMRRAMKMAIRTGIVPIGLGLVRHVRKADRQDEGFVERLGRNSPIQGMGGVIFRKALLLVNERLWKLGAKVILLNHDAIVIEAPIDLLAQAIAETKLGMINAFLSFFPEVIPKVKTTASDVTCWNVG